MLGKKFVTPERFEKKILPIQTKSRSVKSPIPHSINVQWSCQPFRGWGMRRIWHFCKFHPSTKWLARDPDVVVFKTKVLHFKIENTPIKDTNGKRKFKRMLSFLFVDKRKLFAMKLSFEEFNLVFYTADRSAWLVLNQPRQRGFWRHLRYIPYSMDKEKYFLKGNFCIYKGFMDVFYILTLAWKKNHKMYILRERNDLTCLTELLFRINLWVFE